MRKVLSASREEVFDAWLDADGMREWMRPGPVADCQATLEPRVCAILLFQYIQPFG